MLFGSAIPSGTIVVGDVRQNGDSADVQTTAPDGGAARTFHVVREGDRFRVDLALGR
jgi:hypothetical protein